MVPSIVFNERLPLKTNGSPFLPSDLGEATPPLAVTIDGATYDIALVSYYTAPLLAGSRQDYAVFASTAFFRALDGIFGYKSQWSVATNPGKVAIDLSASYASPYTTPRPRLALSIHAFYPGDFFDPSLTPYTIDTAYAASTKSMVGPSPNHMLRLSQNVRPADAAFLLEVDNEVDSRTHEAFALCELRYELKAYIEAAAHATALPARFLAMVIFRELEMRPKHGSPRARALQASRPWWASPQTDAVWAKWYERVQAYQSQEYDDVRGYYGIPKPMHTLDNIRELEIDFTAPALIGAIDSAVEAMIPARYLPKDDLKRRLVDKSIGVCQMQMCQGALAMGKLTYPGALDWNSAKAALVRDFIGLTKVEIIDVFNVLRFPKTNILMFAKIIETWKNMPNRYPGMSPAELLADEPTATHARAVLADDYRHGYRGGDPATIKPGADSIELAEQTNNRLMKIIFP